MSEVKWDKESNYLDKINVADVMSIFLPSIADTLQIIFRGSLTREAKKMRRKYFLLL